MVKNKIKGNIRTGDHFSATIRKSEHSRTFVIGTLKQQKYRGKECAGTYYGTFVATKVTSAGVVESGDRIFRPDLWWLKKIELDNGRLENE